MIELIKNYKYDNRYEYIKMFNTKAEQTTYFNSLSSIVIEDTNYERDNEVFDIDIPYDQLVNDGVNYLIFDNGYREVFAFIITKEYISQRVSRITFEVDVFQTYMFNFDMKKSFIERKNCNINEITDFDEGLSLGEHIIDSENVVFQKDSIYFAMFNGFKEQELIFNDTGKLVSSVDIPYATAKPQTTIDNILYPIYFMRLLEQGQYSDPLIDDIGIGTGGSQVVGEAISKKLFRYIKGYEAFSSKAYMDSGNVPTIGYGVTESNTYWNSLFPECTEEKASKVLAETMYNDYATPLYKDMQSCGVDMALVKQSHFDAFLDLCYNGGLGAVTSSPMYSKWVINQNDARVVDGWETWYVRDNNGTVLNGLIDRRKKEIDIFTNSNYYYKPIAIVGGGVVTDNNGNGHIPDGLGGEI